jgi:hypothetical protein
MRGGAIGREERVYACPFWAPNLVEDGGDIRACINVCVMLLQQRRDSR